MILIDTSKPALDGVSLRDYFAGQALMGCVPGDWPRNDLAVECYAIADAMLATRERDNASRISGTRS